MAVCVLSQNKAESANAVQSTSQKVMPWHRHSLKIYLPNRYYRKLANLLQTGIPTDLVWKVLKRTKLELIWDIEENQSWNIKMYRMLGLAYERLNMYEVPHFKDDIVSYPITPIVLKILLQH